MNPLNRRNFLQMGARLAALMGLAGQEAMQGLARAAEKVAGGQVPVVWLQGQSCSGCSVSFLNSDPVGPVSLITQSLDLLFHHTLSAATGHLAAQSLEQALTVPGLVLIVEGSVPVGTPTACLFAGIPFADQLRKAASRAFAVIAVGTCASSGGIPAAENNPTGAVSVTEFFKRNGIKTPLINIPGCPVHPDWLVGTVVHTVAFGLPELDASHRPRAFFKKLIHDQCPRFADYERERFAKSFGDEGCYFHLGCAGPITHADCELRLWNSGTNSCINAGAPCIGCAREDFAARADFPCFTLNHSSSRSS